MKLIVPDCLFFAQLAVRLTERGGRHEVQRLLDVVFDVSFDEKELHRQVKRAESCECLVPGRIFDALNGEGFEKEKLRRECASHDGSVLLYKKTF